VKELRKITYNAVGHSPEICFRNYSE